MKILLTTLNSRYTHSALALYYLRESIAGIHDATLKEFSINDEPFNIISQISDISPDVAAISVYIWNRESTLKLIRDLKKVLNIRIVCGGPEASSSADEFIAAGADFIIKSGGERAFRHLAEMNFFSETKIIEMENIPFDEVPFPYREEDFLSLKNRYIYYESTRGCPFRCSYCLSSRSRLDARSIDKVKAELQLIAKWNPPIVKFVDRSFNSERKRARELWQFISNLKCDTVFHFEVHPALLQDEDFSLLSNVPEGKFQFEIGIQSANSETLRESDRNFEWEEIKENVERICSLKNIHTHLDLIAGLPFEGMSELAESFDKVYSMKPDHFQLGVLKVLKETKISQKKDEYGIEHSDYPPYRVLNTKWLSFKEMKEIYRIEHLVDNIFNQGKFRATLEAAAGSSPFDFYRELAAFAFKSGYDFSIKERKPISKMIYTFFETKEQKRLLIKDALRFDFLKSEKWESMPDYLKSDTESSERSRVLELIKSEIEKSKSSAVKKREVANISFFIPESMEFKKLFMSEKTLAIFAKNDIISAIQDIADFKKSSIFIPLD